MISPLFILSLIIGYFLVLVGIAYFTGKEDSNENFFKANRNGKLKIIITVRDYAFQEIGKKCQEFSAQRIDLYKLTDEQIIEIIKSKPFEILNSKLQASVIILITS